jgi:hypothetical protein
VTIVAPSAPVVTAATITGQAGHALQYQVNVDALNPVKFAISGTPSGMSISSTGVISWTSPVAGTYSVSVTATDTKTGIAGSATMRVQISASSSGPVITASPINGVAGHPVTGTVGISDPGASNVAIGITGAPTGMTFQASGQAILVSWKKPVTGVYKLTLTAVDTLRLSAQATLVVTITAK